MGCCEGGAAALWELPEQALLPITPHEGVMRRHRPGMQVSLLAACHCRLHTRLHFTGHRHSNRLHPHPNAHSGGEALSAHHDDIRHEREGELGPQQLQLEGLGNALLGLLALPFAASDPLPSIAKDEAT